MARRRGAGSYFGCGEHYSTGIIFGIMSLALLLAAGAALDYARVSDMRNSLETAIDSASVAAGQAILYGKFSDEEVKAAAMSRFDKAVASARHVGTIKTPSVNVDYATKTITLTAEGTVAMTVSRLLGIDEVTVPAMSTVGFPPGAPASGTSRALSSLAYSVGSR